MKNISRFCALLLLVLYTSCKQELTQDFSFLEGSWKMETSDSTYLLESWEKKNDKHFTALSYAVSDTGMQLAEEIELQITDSGTYYYPTIEGLDGPVTYSYKFISQDDSTYVFKNKQNKISVIWYKLLDEKHMNAGIQGADGKDKFVLTFEKVEEEK